VPLTYILFSAGPPEGLKLPNNPGTIEELHKRCQGVFPMCFEGGTLRVNKGLNSHFQVSHTLNLPTNPQSPSGYKFGATYVGTKMLSPTEVIIRKIRGSPTYAVFTTADPTTAIFGSCTSKWAIFVLVGDPLQSH
jgi:hypothetical protein